MELLLNSTYEAVETHVFFEILVLVDVNMVLDFWW